MASEKSVDIAPVTPASFAVTIVCFVAALVALWHFEYLTLELNNWRPKILCVLMAFTAANLVGATVQFAEELVKDFSGYARKNERSA